MKKAVTVLMIIFCVIILFFTFFGETLFYKCKPQVESTGAVYTVSLSGSDRYMPVPTECLADGKYVYVINLTPGFSADIAYVERREIVFDELDKAYIAVTDGIRNGERLVLKTDRPIKDGDKVNVVSDY